MKKHLAYLTKSAEVAKRLSKSFALGNDGVESVGYGAGNNPAIPKIFLGEGYFYCIITYVEDADVEPYRLVIA